MTWLEELKRPATMIAITLGLLGIITGVMTSLYFYKKSEKVGRISLIVEQKTLFNKEHLDPYFLKLIRSDNSVVTANLFIAAITLWNSGNTEIKTNDIRRSFRFVLGDGFTPMNVSIVAYTNKNMNNFVLSKNGDLTWTHFDPGEGFKFNLLYESDNAKKIILE